MNARVIFRQEKEGDTMKKIFTNIVIAICIYGAIYFLSTRFFFKVPSPSGVGYHEVTYEMGRYAGAIAGVVSFILLSIFNRNKKNE